MVCRLKIIFLIPLQTLYRLLQVGLISPATIEQAIADVRSGVATRSVLLRANQPDQNIGRKHAYMHALMQDYPGRPTAGTRMHRSHGRHRQVTRLPAAAEH